MISKRSYIIGFTLSILLTLAAFSLIWLHEYTMHEFPTHEFAKIGLVLFAVLQLVAQLVFFLHLGKKSSLWWNVVAAAFATFVIAVVVGGTLWIMNHLDHNMHGKTPYINGIINPEESND